MPGPLVDTSVVRFVTGSLSLHEVLAQLRRPDTRAVVVGRTFAAYPEVMRAIEARFARHQRVGEISLYSRG